MILYLNEMCISHPSTALITMTCLFVCFEKNDEVQFEIL